MDDGLLSPESFNQSKSSGKSYSEIFEEACPYYLSIGLTPEEYWEGDCQYARYARKAEKLRLEKANQLAWLQGMYVYDAITRVSPILNPFAKKGTKAKPYPTEPYPLGLSSETDKEEELEKEMSDKGTTYLQNFMSKFNDQFNRK